MNILVTGGTGFVGQHLIKQLLKSGHKITAPVRRRANLELHRNLSLKYKDDFFDSEWLLKIMSGIDVIIHTAAFAHQTRKTSKEDKKKFYKVNVELTSLLFDMASKANVKQFVFISSIGAIKSFSQLVINEKTEALPINDYGLSKLAAEKELKKKAESTNVSLTILRPCLIYGQSNPGNMERLSNLLDTKFPLPFGSICSKRTFLYIDNLISAIEVCLLNKACINNEFILADDETVSLQEIIITIAKAKDQKVRLIKTPTVCLRILGVIGDVFIRLFRVKLPFDTYSIERLTSSLACSNQKFKETTGWKPPFSFSEGIWKTFE